MPAQQSLAPHLAETRSAAAQLHVEHAKKSTQIERLLDRLTAALGRPVALAAIAIFVVLWVAINLALPRMGLSAFDTPPFPWLDDTLTLLGLGLGVMILSTQRRAGQLDNLREQMTLELASLTERKVGKMIELIEELRRDSPEVKDRVDTEASAMAERSDQNDIMEAIKETHGNSSAADSRREITDS